MRRPVLLFVLVFVSTLMVASVAFAATRHCNGGECSGTNGSDKIVGSPQAETIHGANGDDALLGRAGDDRLFGGKGNDRVNGEEGNDNVKGSSGADTVKGGPGNDLVRGGDHESANDGKRDVLDCGEGDEDTVEFVPGQDVTIDCEILNPPS